VYIIWFQINTQMKYLLINTQMKYSVLMAVISTQKADLLLSHIKKPVRR
jgi:hypothetical protein